MICGKILDFGYRKKGAVSREVEWWGCLQKGSLARWIFLRHASSKISTDDLVKVLKLIGSRRTKELIGAIRKTKEILIELLKESSCLHRQDSWCVFQSRLIRVTNQGLKEEGDPSGNTSDRVPLSHSLNLLCPFIYSPLINNVEVGEASYLPGYFINFEQSRKGNRPSS